jgi:hypothetical protein
MRGRLFGFGEPRECLGGLGAGCGEAFAQPRRELTLRLEFRGQGIEVGLRQPQLACQSAGRSLGTRMISTHSLKRGFGPEGNGG